MKHSELLGDQVTENLERHNDSGIQKNIIVQEKVTESRLPPPFYLYTGTHGEVVQRKHAKQDELSEEAIEISQEFSPSDPPPAKQLSQGSESYAYPQPFQLKASAENPPIQRDKDDPPVKGGLITIKPENAVNEVSGTYNQVSNQLSQSSEAGSVQSYLPGNITFKDNADGKTVSTTFTVRIVKTMPKWVEYASIKASLKELQAAIDSIDKEIKSKKDNEEEKKQKTLEKEEKQKEKKYRTRILSAWDSVYASIEAHENKHLADEKSIYSALLKEIQGKTENEAMVIINHAGEKGNEKSDAWHSDEKSKIIKWPIVEKEPTKVP